MVVMKKLKSLRIMVLVSELRLCQFLVHHVIISDTHKKNNDDILSFPTLMLTGWKHANSV
jgi:hypothetical protein